MEKINKIIDNLLLRKVSIISWAIGFLGIVMTRLFLDKFIAKSSASIVDPIMDIHNILFFFLSILLVWSVLSLILRKKPLDLAYLMLWASVFIIFPPILDLIKTGGSVFWSFYLISPPKELFFQFLTFFGNMPSGIVYFGTRIVFVFVLLALGMVVFFKTKKLWKSLLTIILAYLSLFFMAAFPSILAYLGIFAEKGRFLDIQGFEIIQWFSSTRIFGIEIDNFSYSLAYNLNFIYFLLILLVLFTFFYVSQKERFLSIIKNFRYPQVIYHSGIFILGFLLAALTFPENFEITFFSGAAFLVIVVSIWLSWKVSVVTNDIYDQEIDKITNKKRPLPQAIFEELEYRNLGIIIFLISIIGALTLNYKFAWLLVLYQFLAWAYSAFPFRLKRFPFIASFISAIASLTIFIAGFILISPEQDMLNFPWRIFFLLMIAYTICLPIKDFKDIKGDKKYGVKTIPVILGEEKSKIFLGTSYFVSYVLSVFFLNEWNLFWWSLIFGSVSFWIINNKKITPLRMTWICLGLVFVYGLILVKIVFF